jgi:hypothetical protein
MIIGAGLTGLIAAHAFQDHIVLEASSKPQDSHQALLRFRSDDVSKIVGIPFYPVTVRKGIWMNKTWKRPSINIANTYSKKVIGEIIDRSIWNLDTVTRWIAPENFYDQLIESVSKRIEWDSKWDFSETIKTPIINTAPLQYPARQLAKNLPEFKKAEITVLKFRIKNCNVYQTVYFPDPSHNLYRASITKDLLICEFVGEAIGNLWTEDLLEAFAIPDPEMVSGSVQDFGKIAPIDEQLRRELIIKLTNEKGIFSLGRFGTWRNILLDDVVKDIAILRFLMNASEYRRKLWQK